MLYVLILFQKMVQVISAEIINILKGEKDQWFRPADVCVAPDGSLIIADWYDPGVGGHQAGDQTRGRIYRVAPPGSNYTIPKEDYIQHRKAPSQLCKIRIFLYVIMHLPLLQANGNAALCLH